MDLEDGTLKSTRVVVMLVGVVGFMWLISPYFTGAEDMRLHLKEYPLFVMACAQKDAQQDQEIALLKRDLISAADHRGRVEKQISDVVEHLSRLKLVSSVEKPNKDKQITNLLKEY